MKKKCVWLAVIVCVLLAAQSAFGANSTLITSEVPSAHTLAVSCGEHGAVSIGGVRYTGAFTLTVPRHETVVLRALPDDGYALAAASVSPSSDTWLTETDIVLDSVYEDKTVRLSFEPETTRVSFVVTDDEDNLLPGAALALSLDGKLCLAGETNASGRFAADLLKGKTYTLTASLSGYETVSDSFTADLLTKTVTVRMRGYQNVGLLVLLDGAPCAGAGVSLGGLSLMTDASGCAQCVLVNGEYRAEILLPDGTNAFYPVTISGAGDYVISLQSISEEEEPLYTGYLGTGGGEGDLLIVYDRENVPQPYSLIPYDLYTADELSGENVRQDIGSYICIDARPDVITGENGTVQTALDSDGAPVYSERRLALSGRQLNVLLAKDVQSLLFTNGDFETSFAISDLISGELGALLGSIYTGQSGLEQGQTLLSDDVAALKEAAELSFATQAEQDAFSVELMGALQMELRITPIEDSALFAAVQGAAYPDESGLCLMNDGLAAAREASLRSAGRLLLKEHTALLGASPVMRAFRTELYLTVNGVTVEAEELVPSMQVSIRINALCDREISEAEDRPAADEQEQWLLGLLPQKYKMLAVHGAAAREEKLEILHLTASKPMPKDDGTSAGAFDVDVAKQETDQNGSVYQRYLSLITRKEVFLDETESWYALVNASDSAVYLIVE